MTKVRAYIDFYKKRVTTCSPQDPVSTKVEKIGEQLVTVKVYNEAPRSKEPAITQPMAKSRKNNY